MGTGKKRINSRVKGKVAELEFVDILKGHGWKARRGCQFQGGPDSPDVITELPIHFEVKAVQNLNIHNAIQQACDDCPTGKWRAVAHKKNHRGWVIAMPLEDFMDLLKERFGGDE